jgi:hypothetical protein
MDQLQLKIHFNQFKYGPIFMIVLGFIHQCNIYNLETSESQYCVPYTELCESFFETLIKEVTYHNYILLLNHDNYSQLIENCLNKSIHLKNREYYDIQIDKQKELGESLYDPLTKYLELLKNQIRMRIEIRPLHRSSQDNLSVKIISGEDLEKHYQNMRKCQSCNQKKSHQGKKNSCYQLRKIQHDELPSVKMQPIHPRPPIIDKCGNISFQKNFLDI